MKILKNSTYKNLLFYKGESQKLTESYNRAIKKMTDLSSDADRKEKELESKIISLNESLAKAQVENIALKEAYQTVVEAYKNLQKTGVPAPKETPVTPDKEKEPKKNVTLKRKK